MTSTKCIVIGKKQTGEQDIQLVLLSPDHGKIYAKAKGANKITSSRLGSLQLGNFITCTLSRSQPFYINQTKSNFSFLQKTKTLAQTGLLFFLLELINKITPAQEPNPELFKQVLLSIQSIEKGLVGQFIMHELKIINLLGYGTPQAIQDHIHNSNFRGAQQTLQHYIENIIDKPLQSKKLFS